MLIPFTQYMLPNGRTKQTFFAAKPETEDKARIILEKGCHFDIEILTTGAVSMTCERNLDSGSTDDVVSIIVCENGPGVEDMVKELIDNAYEKINEE